MNEEGMGSRELAGSTPGSARRNSLAGMFPFLQKQQSMDTDSSDRHQRRFMGGKVKPGKQHSRSSSGDVSDSLTPGPGDVSSSAAWHAAAGHGSSSNTPQGWPSSSPAPSTSTSTPTRGLFNKLLSGKKKQKGCHSPTHVAIPNSPPLGSLSLGASSIGSQSPRSQSEQLPDFTLNVGAYGRSSSSNGAGPPITPPHHHRHAVDADRGDNEDGDYDSCYCTPVGSEAMLSPNQDYGGDTLDLRHMVYDAHGDKSPMPMGQDLPEVFTPGFNELLQQAGGRLQPQEPDTPAAGAAEEPTVALLTCAQLAQAGRMYDAPAMLLDPAAAEQQQGSAAASCSSSRCNSSIAAGSKAASRLTSAVASPEPVQAEQHAVTNVCSPSSAVAAVDVSEQQPLCAEDIELQVEAAVASVEDAQSPANAAAATAAADQSRPSSSTPDRNGAADDAVTSAPAVAECAAAALEPAAHATEDNSTAVADACQLACEESTLAGAAVSTEDGASPAVTEQPPLPEAVEPSCSVVGEPAAVEEQQQQPELVQESAAAEEPSGEAGIVPNRSSSSSSPVGAKPEEAVEQAAPAAVDSAAEALTAEPAVEGAIEQVAEAAVEQAGEAAVEQSSAEEEQAAEPAESPLDAGLAEEELARAAAAAAAAEEPVEDAATSASPAVVGDQVDEFVLLEQQVIAEVAEEAAVDEFALLEQQVAAEEAEADEFAELERLAAAEAAAEVSAGSVAAEGSSGSMGSMPAMQITEEPSLPASEPSEGAEGDAPALTTEHSSSPDGTSRPSAAGSDDSPVLGLTSTARRAARRSPMNLVRESMPLFLADPSRAMGSPLALQPGEESLDDQDMQQLSAGNAYRGSSGGGYGGTRLLSHGGAQRVSLGGSGLAGGSSFMSSLEPVEEASFNSAGSPIPEGSPSFANQHGIGDSPSSDGRCPSAAAAGAGSPSDVSPLHPRRLSSSPSRAQDAAAAGQVTPCSMGGGPNLAMTPGSVYSTPTLAFGASGQDLMTPQSHTSSAIGSAIRAAGAVAGPLQLSPAMPDSMPEASPTLMLIPGQGYENTVGLQGADGSTPSLLDARAASPSAVYATRFTATPFRGALAALPMDAALAAPLVDSSPFSLRDDCGMDTVCLADEAQRVAANLAAAAAGSYSPGQASTPMHVPQQTASPGSAAGDGRAGSPTGELRDLQNMMLTRQLAELQKHFKEVEAENVRLKEQVEIYEFEKTELNSQEEMEKQARQYAEEQLQAMQVELQQMMQAKAAQAAQMLALKQEFEAIQRDAQEKHNAMRAAHQELAAKNAQLQDERDTALDQLNMHDMQNTALKSNNNELMHALEGEQRRNVEMERELGEARRVQEECLAELRRVQDEYQAKVEKIMGQVIAADTSKEHYRQKATDEAAKAQQLLAEREKRAQDYQHLKQKYAHKSAAIKEYEAKLQAKDAENLELMTMCDQLLQQQEARRS